MKAKDLVGQRFGKLVVTARAEKTAGSGQTRWECVCDCGGTTVAHGTNLRRGKTTSCGCAVAEANRRRLLTHGMSKSKGKPGHEIYQIWLGIRRRCLFPNDAAYPRYGGRGISMAGEWQHDFPQFLADVGPRPSKAHSLDRIDNDGNYEPSNVRWATAKEQADNRGPVARLRRENAELKAEADRVPALLALVERLTALLATAERKAEVNYQLADDRSAWKAGYNDLRAKVTALADEWDTGGAFWQLRAADLRALLDTTTDTTKEN